MAAWKTEIVEGKYVAQVSVKRCAKAVSRNGYDPEKHLRDMSDTVIQVSVTADDIDSLKKKVFAVLEGGL